MIWRIKHSLNDMFEGDFNGKYLGGSTEPTLLDAKLAILEREAKEKEAKEKNKKLVIDYWFDQYYFE